VSLLGSDGDVEDRLERSRLDAVLLALALALRVDSKRLSDTLDCIATSSVPDNNQLEYRSRRSSRARGGSVDAKLSLTSDLDSLGVVGANGAVVEGSLEELADVVDESLLVGRVGHGERGGRWWFASRWRRFDPKRSFHGIASHVFIFCISFP
jgi:hypothetical protein